MQSIWSKTCCMEERAALNRDIKTQTAVIGGGMAGVLTAWALSEAGVDTVVLEARTVGSGQTQNTTAKLTAQHGLIYHRLIQSFGRKRAAQYAQANLNAVDRYRALIEEKKIPWICLLFLPSFFLIENGQRNNGSAPQKLDYI